MSKLKSNFQVSPINEPERAQEMKNVRKRTAVRSAKRLAAMSGVNHLVRIAGKEEPIFTAEPPKPAPVT